MNSPALHLEERLERDITALRERVRSMAKLVVSQLKDAVSAFSEGDRKLAYRVVLRDHRIDVMERHIDRMCQEFLVRHMPVSTHLRFAVAVAKVNSELERIGDYAEAIARRVAVTSEARNIPQREHILQMSKVSFGMLDDAVEAFLQGDAEAATRTLDADQQVDRLNSQIFEALAEPAEGNVNLPVRFALVGLINRIERVADRACNIAEEAVYVVRGEVLRHLPREDVRVLFLCRRNACRSQMAEAIARSVAPGHLIFASAGTDPGALDRGAVDFMLERGLDISRQRSKSTAKLGPIEDFNVIVTLCKEAEDTCPAVAYDAVQLHWDIADPSLATGSAEERHKAYQECFESLDSRIKELTDALIGADRREEEA
ncbi:MAG: phosphate signaling complex protein PhoU [Proteobacteria bacterium]|nr:phosphate signaling complex protein PhoU [Pseudomonadota bacterium]